MSRFTLRDTKTAEKVALASVVKSWGETLELVQLWLALPESERRDNQAALVDGIKESKRAWQEVCSVLTKKHRSKILTFDG